MGYKWRFDVVWESLPLLLQGLGTTVFLTVVSMAAGLLLGLIISLIRLSPIRPLSIAAKLYIELFRGTPLLVQLLWIYYSLPIATGIILSPLNSALIGLALNLSAFIAEIFRAGIQSIGRGQREAALAMGMTSWQSLYRVVLPQALRRIIPPMGSVWVSLFKDTSIVSVIATADIMYQAKVLSVQTYRPVEIFTVVAVIYFLLTYPQARFVDWLFQRVRVRN